MFESIFKKKQKKNLLKLTREEKQQEKINNRLRESLSSVVFTHLENGELTELSIGVISDSFERMKKFHEQMGFQIDCSRCPAQFNHVSCQKRLVKDGGACVAKLIPLSAVKKTNQER